MSASEKLSTRFSVVQWWRAAPAAQRLRVLGGVLFVVVAVMAGRKLLGKVTDFDVITDAVTRWRAGGDIYAVQPGRPEQFWYPAWVLVPIGMAQDLFGATGVRVLATLLCAGSTVSMARDLGRISGLCGWVVRPVHVLLFVALFGRCFSNNFTNGQFSIVVGALLTHSVHAVLVRSPLRAGLALGCAAAMKVTPALVIVALPLLGQLGAASVAALVAGTLVLVLPWPVVGFTQHADWLLGFWDLATGSLGGSAGGESMQVNLQQARSASVLGTLDHVLRAPEPTAGHPAGFYWVDLGSSARRVAIAVWSLALIAISVVGCRSARSCGDSDADAVARRPLGIHLAILLLLTSLLSPQAKPYHFLHHAWSAWLFVVLWSRAGWPGWRWPRGSWVGWWVVAAMFALAMPLRQKSMLGVSLWRALDECGLLHLALVGQLVLLATIARSGQACAASSPRI